VTPPRPPTWREFERFLAIDGWVEVRRTGHVFYEKVLPGGEILQTHRSLAGDKTMSMGRFRAILAVQARVSVAEFWAALTTGDPVPRPSPQPEVPPPGLPAWLALALEHEVGLDGSELQRLDVEAAQTLLNEHRSRELDGLPHGPDPDAKTVTAVFDSIPGAWESIRRGEEDYAAGRVLSLDEWERLADEAEAGFDPSTLRFRRERTAPEDDPASDQRRGENAR
jgi:hypothetical protein